MGQVALGFRSLLFKLAIFFVMAALLAWALGGTLWPLVWPRAEIVDQSSVSFDSKQFHWRLTVGGRERGSIRWMLMYVGPDAEPVPFDHRVWLDVTPPVLTSIGLCYGGQLSRDQAWYVASIAEDGSTATVNVPDRLEVERQIARLQLGLPIEDAALMLRRRPIVLDPPDMPLYPADD